MRVDSVEFGSLLSYTPNPSTAESQKAKDVMYAIKNDSSIEDPPIQTSDWIARTIQENMATLPFSALFRKNPVLVPVPRSTLAQADSLWVPHRIASALFKERIGKEVLACVTRAEPIRKAASSTASQRPRPSEQYRTMRVQGSVSEPQPEEIVMVDDIVTRGATFLGAANRLVEAFPKARIRAFAAMRTISNSSEFTTLYNPCAGTIEYRENTDDSLRRP